MGRDLSFKFVGEMGDMWTHVPTASRNNEILGYINKTFTKSELEDHVRKLIKETMSYDYNMKDIANAIASLEFVLSKMTHVDSVHIKYQ